MPVPVAEEQQIIVDTTFDEDIEYSPSALREWFTTNKVTRAIAHLFGLAYGRATRIRATRYGELYIRWSEAQLAIAESKTAGDTSDNITTDQVPEDEIWIVERIYASNISSTTGSFRLEAWKGGVASYLVMEYNLAAGEAIYVDGPITLMPGAYLNAAWFTITAGDTLHFHVWGRKIYLRQGG